MDTKPVEIQAESLIEHKLIKHNFLVAKPSFDKEGADLLIVKNITKKITPFIKIQCKGRLVDNRSNVKIPQKYIDENFVVFLYIEKKESKEDFLYVFFEKDIKKWTLKEDVYQLNIPKKFDTQEKYRDQIFNKEKALFIENILLRQALEKVIKSFDSILIDGIFLEKAVKQTMASFKNEYPNQKFKKPTLDELIKQFRRHAHMDENNELNCYLIYSTHFSLEYSVEIGDPTLENLINNNSVDIIGKGYNLYKLKTDEIISFKIEEQLNRLVNTENVLLVADDPAYVPYLDALKKKDIEIKILKTRFSSLMPSKFKYQYITYPISDAIMINNNL
jgi:hypothetical protein